MTQIILRRSFLMLVGIVAAASVTLAQSPTITFVSKISTQEYQTIVIRGSGFGTQSPYTGDSISISFYDLTANWQAGYDGCYWGYCTTNVVTLIADSWKDKKITLGGFSGGWGEQNWTLNIGDQEQVCVWNAQSGDGPACVTTTIIGAKTTTTLTSSPNPSTYGQQVTFTAVVTSADGAAPPDGETVAFMKGKTQLGTGTLSDGSATFTTSTLLVGTTTVTAVYSGDSVYDGSKSKPVKQVVE